MLGWLAALAAAPAGLPGKLLVTGSLLFSLLAGPGPPGAPRALPGLLAGLPRSPQLPPPAASAPGAPPAADTPVAGKASAEGPAPPHCCADWLRKG